MPTVHHANPAKYLGSFAGQEKSNLASGLIGMPPAQVQSTEQSLKSAQDTKAVIQELKEKILGLQDSRTIVSSLSSN